MAAVQSGRLGLCLSEALLSELGRVLKRAKLASRLQARGETAQGVVGVVRTVAEIVKPADVEKPAIVRPATVEWQMHFTSG